jgi:hypothetical protein
MATTPKGAPYPAATDANDVPADLQALATWVDARPGVSPLTTAQRDALTGADLWDGRVIFNLTAVQLERYDAAATVWRTASISDHGALSGLADDDHPQYLNNTRHDTPTRHGATVVDHGSIGGLGDDDHPQYILKSLIDAKGDLLAGSGADALGRLAAGADGQILTADAAAALGVKWAAAPAPAPELIALTAYRPSSDVWLDTTSTAFVDADATNLAVTFTMPASGRVLIRLSGLTSNSASYAHWALREGTANVADTAAYILASDTYSRRSSAFLLTGTAGATRTVKWAHKTSSASYSTSLLQGPTLGTSTMEVWSA